MRLSLFLAQVVLIAGAFSFAAAGLTMDAVIKQVGKMYQKELFQSRDGLLFPPIPPQGPENISLSTDMFCSASKALCYKLNVTLTVVRSPGLSVRDEDVPEKSVCYKGIRFVSCYDDPGPVFDLSHFTVNDFCVNGQLGMKGDIRISQTVKDFEVYYEIFNETMVPEPGVEGTCENGGIYCRSVNGCKFLEGIPKPVPLPMPLPPGSDDKVCPIKSGSYPLDDFSFLMKEDPFPDGPMGTHKFYGVMKFRGGFPSVCYAFEFTRTAQEGAPMPPEGE